jgi:hypothetical protein
LAAAIASSAAASSKVVVEKLIGDTCTSSRSDNR